MKLFSTTSTDSDLYPRQDPEVIRLHAEVQEARQQAAPAAGEAARLWRQDNCQGTHPAPDSDYWAAKKTANDLSQVLERAEAAHTLALTAATAQARRAWDEKIRQQFLDEQPAVEAFIELLATHERWVAEAGEAGVSGVLNVPQVFLTHTEVMGRLDYAQRALGLT
jgi:Tfp pilus assembly protein FimT